MGVGQEHPLGPAGAEAHARPTAAAEGDERLGDLVAALLVVGEGVDERHEPVPAVGLDDGQERPRPETGAEHAGHVAHPEAADEEDRPGEDGHGDGRSHVGLEHHEGAEEAEHEAHRPQHPAPVADVGRPAGEHVGAVQEQGQLGQLGGLEAGGPDAEPSGRAVDVDPHAGDQHEQEQAGGDHQEQADVAAQDPVVDAGGDDEPGQAEDRPGELALEEQPRRPVVGQRLHRRRREHHDEADQVEDDDGRQQGVITRRPQAAAVAPHLPGPADGPADPGLASPPAVPGGAAPSSAWV